MQRYIGNSSQPLRARFVLGSSPRLVQILALILGCLQFLPGIAHGAEPLSLTRLQHKSWNVSDGAPARNHFLTQGADGNLWISALDGLYRFDGLKFAPFRLPEGISPTSNYSYSFRVSSSGVLFAGSFLEGIITIDHDKIRAFGTKDGLPRAPIVSLAEGPDHHMRCVSAGRIFRLDRDRWSDEGVGENLPAGLADTLLFDRAGTLWVATNTGRLYFRRAGEQSFQITDETWDPAYGIMNLLEGPDGSLWIGLQNFKGKQESIIRQLNVEGHPAASPVRLEYPYGIWDLLFDQSGALWVTGQGVRRVTFIASGRTARGGPILRVLRDEVVMEGLSSTATEYLCKDNEGDIWVSTLRGIERFRTPSIVATAPRATDPRASADVAAGPEGSVWVLAGDQQIAAYRGSEFVAKGPQVPFCFDLFEDRDGAIWYRDLENLWRLDHGRLSKVLLPQSINIRRLMQIAQLRNGSMLFLFDTFGLWTWNSGKWSALSLNLQSDGQITAIFPEPEGTLWLGYASGHVATSNGDVKGPLTLMGQTTLGTIYAFLQTPVGFFVSGADGVAIFRRGVFERLTFVDDADVVGVSGMIQSLDGDLWLNSAHGVIHVAKAEMQRALAATILQPIAAEVFSEPEIHGPAKLLSDLPTIARDATGRLWFNTSDTIAFIDPPHVARNAVAPILTISSISSDGRALAGRLRVPAGSHTLRIQYFGSNLTAPEKVRYKYRLDGVDDDWQDVGGRTEAVYTRLHPGSYTFHVMASNGEGAWSQPVGLTFTELPTFYQTTWFLAFCCAAAISLAVLAFKVRINSIARRLRDRAEERANERIRIARDLHDTLLQGFQGLMLSFHVAMQTVPKDTQARALLENSLLKADRLVREGRDRVSRLRSESLEGVSLPDALKALGEELNSHQVHRFEIQVTQTRVEIKPQVKDELFCIAREAITNSFCHAEATTIGANLDYGKRVLAMICYDDGCGIDAPTVESAPRFHYGMLGMGERARRIGATYSCDSAPGRGTKVIVRIPAGRAYVRNGWFSAWFGSLRHIDSRES
jgi:signal transduction histidine kinase/ligand-binding sensor domain-containing protein